MSEENKIIESAEAADTTADVLPRKSYYSERQKNYTMRYLKEKCSEVRFWALKEEKLAYKHHAELMGETIAPFLKRAIRETVKRDIKELKKRGIQIDPVEKALASGAPIPKKFLDKND